MTIAEIMEMAERLNVYEPCHFAADAEKRLLLLVADIEATEREKCAKLCEFVASQTGNQVGLDCAAAIRLRGHR